jgi:cation diffusion facilitator family transporter
MALTRNPAERAALVAIVITCLLALAKAVVWAVTGSLAVLSQALDSVVDVVALGLVFVGVRFASKPADADHNYGHAKAENLVAFTQTLILAGIALAIGIEAIRRMSGPIPEVSTPWFAFALLGASALIDLWRVRSLLKVGRTENSEALKAGALNLAGDIGTALVTLVSLALVRSGADRADAIGGLIVAAFVLLAAARLGKRSVDVLMDRAPESPLDQVVTAASRVPGVAETRRVRVRGTSDNLFADVTVAARRSVSLERAHDIAEEVEREIGRSLPGTDVVVHVEPAAESAGLVERVQAAASRTPGVYEIHNVQVHAFGDDADEKLRVTLHAKVPSGTSLGEAHDISERIERSVAGELWGAVRVDTHIEPLHLTSLGRDVTGDRRDLVDEIIALAEREADVIDCHEVVATQTGDDVAVVLHVTGKGDLPLDDMHEASERIEEAVKGALPEIRSVLIHFEPS